MARYAWACAILAATAVASGCSGDGADRTASSDLVRTVVVTPTVTATATVTATTTPGTASTSASITAAAPTTSSSPAAPSPSSAATGAPGAPSRRTTAAPAAYSAQVASLQKALRGQGFYAGEPTGVEDDATRSAVRAFQRAHGLTEDGVAGPAVWGALTGSAPQPSAVPSQDAPTHAAEPTTAAPPVERCGEYYLEWDAAVAENRRSRAQAAHDKGAAAGCSPDTWLPSRSKTTYDPGTTHAKGDSCSMSEVGTYDAAGNVCTQDRENDPHWN